MKELGKANFTYFQVFIGIIMGLGVEKIIDDYVGMFNLNDGNLIWDQSVSANLSVLAILVLIIRFFHGNIRILEEADKSVGNPQAGIRIGQWIDFLVITSQGLAFCALGHFIKDAVNLRWIVIWILSMDVIWILISLFSPKISERVTSKEVKPFVQKMAGLNFLSLIILLLFQLLYIEQELGVMPAGIIFSLVIIGGSVADYSLNRKFYFPPADKPKEATA